MGKMKALAHSGHYHARSKRPAPVLPMAPDNSLISGLRLMPNCEHYMVVSLPGSAIEIHLTQNQMHMLFEMINEARCEITIDDGRSDRLHPYFIPLGAGGRL